jgi:hypothetical protein
MCAMSLRLELTGPHGHRWAWAGLVGSCLRSAVGADWSRLFSASQVYSWATLGRLLRLCAGGSATKHSVELEPSSGMCCLG